MSDSGYSNGHSQDAPLSFSRAQISDLVRKAQIYSIIEQQDRQRFRNPLSSRRLKTAPVYAAGGGGVDGSVWKCTPSSQFTFPAWSRTPFIRVVFRARLREAATPGPIRRFRIFFDCGNGFIDRDSRSFNVVGDAINIDAAISMPSAAMAFALAPVDTGGELFVDEFRMYSQSRTRARLEMLMRRLKLRHELRATDKERRSRIRNAVGVLRKGATAPSAALRNSQRPMQRSLLQRARRYAPHLWGIYRTSGPGGVRQTLLRRLKSKPPAQRRLAQATSVFRKHLTAISSISEARTNGPFISILMPVYNTPPDVLDAAIQSVLAQSWPNWELCVCDDCSTSPATAAILDKYRGCDWRIKISRSPVNLHISGATNAAAEFATGEFIAFLDHDDVIEPKALEEIVARVVADPDIDLLYTDEDKLEEDGRLSEPYLKPDWSPEHLQSVMYVLHFLVVRKRLFLELGGLRSEYSGAQDYDLALRASRKARKIAHIPRVLYHWRKIPGSAAAEVDAKPQALLNGRKALEDHVRGIDPEAKVEDGLLTGTHRVRWPISTSEPVTLLIVTAPTWREVAGRGKILLVENFIDSILAKSTFPAFKLLVVASNPLPESLVDKITQAKGRVVDYRYEGSFNYSAKMNFALQHVETEDVILLNDDLEVISQDWIEALLEQSRRPEIGAAGARLLFADGRLQHAGIVLGVNESAAHVFHGLGAGEYGCHAITHIVRNYSAVTAAALATRMSVLRQIGMFDPDMRVDFNDIDVCLKIREAGFRIVYTPFAELYHFEGQSLRRVAQDPRDTAAFLRRWKEAVAADPYYNPGLPKDRTDCHVENWLAEDEIAELNPAYVQRAFDGQRRSAIAEAAACCGARTGHAAGSFYRIKADILASGLFDSTFYLGQYADVAAANMDPLDHFILYGAVENRRPCANFDTKYYRETSLNGRLKDENPLLHYIREGEVKGYAPSPRFDPLAYAAQHPDVAATGVSPLWHYQVCTGEARARNGVKVRTAAAPPRIEVSMKAQRKWTKPEGLRLGVNFIGPTEIVSGLGVSARGYLRAAEAARIPTHEVSWQAGFEHQAKVPSTELDACAVAFPQAINLIHLNADIMHFAMPKLRALVTPERYNVGIWYWELASFRPDWMEWIELLDEVWCSSEFAARAIGANSRNPVKVVRPAISMPAKINSRIKRASLGLTPKAFVFYYNFDVGSGLHRKNPLALIKAFLAEFAPKENVQLLLKMHYSRTDSIEAQRLLDLARSRDNIIIVDKTLSDDDMLALWSLVDCYVSPHRSEGLGLTVIEAMLAGKPVIGTPYGGVADFLNAETGFPVDYKFIELTETIEPYPMGFIWADPQIGSLRRRLREVFEDPNGARKVAEAGRTRIGELFSSEVAGRELASELRRIWGAADHGQTTSDVPKEALA